MFIKLFLFVFKVVTTCSKKAVMILLQGWHEAGADPVIKNILFSISLLSIPKQERSVAKRGVLPFFAGIIFRSGA
jgi:hypothetical protein